MSGKNETVAKKLSKLHEMVAWFESDEFVLEDAVERFKEAEKLADDIERDLSELKNDIVVLKQKFDGE